ncbi:hypothetical protein GC093_21805 [Paenibacillus sp. LMG 31456]|uniref:Heparinase n=1 Tax=Paenibacillus foliorum TaxID=2654974 RepID=A0A972H3Z1_9BACL|nr:hypothetical protein [Paenibacillus foliorum]NOU95836.1 hypothetical protein [Paenibacillus foliorum]
MSFDHKQMLLRRLDSWHKEYTPEVKMVRKPFRTPGYHSTLKNVDYTHPTREALIYALALLDSGLPDNIVRASEILEKVIGLQDQNRENSTFGIWSWFMEEPLTMMAPPDWNWADFCGKRLVLAEQRHSELLSPALREQIRYALFCACDAIIKRNVGPGYTNIAIMGAFVTLLTGEVYGHKPYADYGLERLRKFSDYTKELGTFQEYNSPTYTIVAIEELASIHTATSLAEAKELSAGMLDVAWRMVAEHFHAPSRQWSGPHSRSYSTVMTPEVLSFLQMASGGVLSLRANEDIIYNLDWYGNEIHCPEMYLPAFQHTETSTILQAIHKDESGRTVNGATTYMNGPISVGTFSKDVMWNQRRNLLGYVQNSESFSYIHLRFLHDGYDYSSAIYSSAQQQGDILFGIGFCTNGGDTHISLDLIDGVIETSDLRLRFEIGGSLEQVEAQNFETNAESITVQVAASTMNVKALFAAFDGEQLGWELTRDEQKLYLDYVLYAGERKSFDFRSIQQALLVFAFRLSEGDGGMLDASAGYADDEANAALDGSTQANEVHAEFRTVNGINLKLELPLKPAAKQEMMRLR